jgi:RsiW-degrading membrane proteinase PrsW (M82 family)
MLTANSNLVPTIVLLGSFLVPVTFVVWAYEHGRSAQVTVPLLFTAFVVGGVLGVLGAALLEAYLLHPSVWLYAGVGLIEEAVKLAALVFVARRLHPRTMRDGLVLGATVGFGFAAFESAGYAFNARSATACGRRSSAAPRSPSPATAGASPAASSPPTSESPSSMPCGTRCTASRSPSPSS